MKNDLNMHIFIFILIFYSILYSQDPIDVSIKSKGISAIPADRIQFKISLSIENSEYQAAFDTHKNQMKVLMKILNQFNFPDSVIKFSLFNIKKSRGRTRTDILYRTNQKIYLLISKISMYEKLQLTLISKGFYSFSAHFYSSKPSVGIEIATQNAIQNAERKIKMIIQELGKEKYKIINIEVDPISKPKSGEVFEFFSVNSRDTIEKIPQVINFTVELRIKYQVN